ncbi:helix-turn-helix domain-containing protein [Chitinophaga varians]|uniref:helix-turn-helix domain-containing protein n=1 Tax=Chitinophaga varians TaxID=2202339 RepID=UPI00165FBF43|nr:AraC family transcriptional regulator [Chitinophaga varians]MBC9912599.1 helix-turn-helix transcriptional regulator [Chitinophaga varians]
MYLDALLPHATLVKESEARGYRQAAYTLAPESGLQGSFEHTVLDGFEINYSHLEVSKRTTVQLNAGKSCVEMHFSLSGQFVARNEVFRKPVEVAALQHSLFSVPEKLSTHFEYQTGEHPLVKVDILLDRNFFESISHEDSAIHSSLRQQLVRNEMTLDNTGLLHVTPQMLSVLTDMITSRRTGYYGKMLMEARVLELFMLQTEALQEKFPEKACGYLLESAGDIEKLYFIKELIDKEPELDHSLKKLSRQAGLNIFKLKNGFKSVFGDTVFGYIHHLRMEKARKLLLEGEQVSTVAYLLGYTTPNNFSTAFRKRFGISPGKFKR